MRKRSTANSEIIMGGSFDPADIDEISEIINEACWFQGKDDL